MLDRSTTPYRLAHAPPGPWCKGATANRAVEESDADIVVLHDADVWCDGLPDAIQAVMDGASWAVPHRGVFRLDEDATARVLDGEEPHEDMGLTQRPYLGTLGGGIVVASREVMLSISLDERFVGWGQEDSSWGIALGCLLGPPWRGHQPLYHLWHPPQERDSRRRGSRPGWALFRRYHAARNDPAAMRALIEEGRLHALAATQPDRHDRAPA